MCGISAVGRGLGDLTGQGGGGHLTAGHAVDGVVDENNGNVLVTCGSVNGLCHTDGGKVTVTLVGKYDILGICALDAGCNGGCAAVCGLNHVTVEIVICHNGAANGSDTDRVAFNSKLIHDLCDQSVHDTVRATGAVVHGHIRQSMRSFENYHDQLPPAIFSMLSSTCSGEGIIPPALLHRYTGRMHSSARRTSSII